MRIWVDADACPTAIKEILYRAATRTQTPLVLVANQPLQTPRSALITRVQVAAGFDVADNYIVRHLQPGDLVVTADIPLAAEVVAQQGTAINPRGARYTPDNIQQRLAMRNLMEELRNSGQVSGGPAPFSRSDRQAFANTLDRLLTKA